MSLELMGAGGVGLAVVAPTTLMKDTFTPAGDYLPNHFPDTTGNMKPVILGGGAWFTVASNLAKETSDQDSDLQVLVWDVAQKDVTITSSINGPGFGYYGGIAFRVTDVSNCWIAVLTGSGGVSNILIIEVVSGTKTTRATTAFSGSINTTYSLKLVVSGTTVTFTVNGNTTATYATMATSLAATKHGLVHDNNIDRSDNTVWGTTTITTP